MSAKRMSWAALVLFLLPATDVRSEVLVLRSSASHLESYQQPIRTLTPPPAALTPDAILPARSAPLAREIAGPIPSAWVAPPIALDRYAVWINETGNAATGRDVVYSVDFDVTDAFTSAAFHIVYAVDNAIGTGGHIDGILLNGSPLPGSYGGTHERESIQDWPEVGGLLHLGRNSLLIRTHNGGLQGGFIFVSTIVTSGPPPAELKLAITAPPLARSGDPIRMNLQALNYTGGGIPLALVVVQIGSTDAVVTPHFIPDDRPGLPAAESGLDAFVFPGSEHQYIAFFVGGLSSDVATDLGTVDIQVRSPGPNGEARGVPIVGVIVPITPPSTATARARKELHPADAECVSSWFAHSMFDPFTITPADLFSLTSCVDAIGMKLMAGGLLALVAGDYYTAHNATFGQVFKKGILQLGTCAASLGLSGALVSVPVVGGALGVCKELFGLYCTASNASYCGAPPPGPCSWDILTWVGSLDPNDKGGSGRGLSPQFVRADAESINFEIHNENAPGASSPAAAVTIIDTLDAEAFDLSGLALGNATFGQHSISLARRPLGGTTYVDLRPQRNALVGIRAQLSNLPSGQILTWDLRTFDPRTLVAPSDPLLGFLPADLNPPQGMGDVRFSIPLRSGLAEGQRVRNRAAIIFDNNPAILTNEWLRIVDRQKPDVRLDLVRTEGADATIRLIASDHVSGLAALRLGVELDGVDYLLHAWEGPGPVDTTLTIVGLPRGSITFKATASDRAGNLLSDPSEVNASMQYVPTALALSVWPNPSHGRCVMRAGPASSKLAAVHVYDVSGRRVRDLAFDPALGTRQAQWDGLNNAGLPVPSGLYLVLARGVDGSRSKQRIAIAR